MKKQNLTELKHCLADNSYGLKIRCVNQEPRKAEPAWDLLSKPVPGEGDSKHFRVSHRHFLSPREPQRPLLAAPPQRRRAVEPGVPGANAMRPSRASLLALCVLLCLPGAQPGAMRRAGRAGSRGLRWAGGQAARPGAHPAAFLGSRPEARVLPRVLPRVPVHAVPLVPARPGLQGGQEVLLLPVPAPVHGALADAGLR